MGDLGVANKEEEILMGNSTEATTGKAAISDSLEVATQKE
jgi:hypothetical protein